MSESSWDQEMQSSAEPQGETRQKTRIEVDDRGHGSEEPKREAKYHNMAVLDLTQVADPGALDGAELKNIGCVLVPEERSDLLARARCENVGAVIPAPKGTKVQTLTGQGELTGKTLAKYDENTLVMVVGQYVITAPVPPLRCRGIMLVGQIFVPKQAYADFADRISMQVGQIGHYVGERARLWTENARIDRAFLELIDEPTALVFFEEVTFAEDVTPDLLRAKISSIAATELIHVKNAELQGMVRFLAVSHFGEIKVG